MDRCSGFIEPYLFILSSFFIFLYEFPLFHNVLHFIDLYEEIDGMESV